MKKVNLDISIPASLSEITLGEYQRYTKVLQANTDKDGNINEGTNDFLNIKALEIFCGLDTRELYNLPLASFSPALEQIQRCFDEEKPLVKEFIFRDPDGVEQHMGFIPNLDKMTIGEYVDLDKYIGDWDNMHRAMAVLYRPIRVKAKDNYKIDDYNGTETYAEAMKEMPVSYAFGAVVFFYRLGRKLCKHIPSYLAKQVELSDQQRAHLQKIGAGILASSLFVEGSILASTRQLGLTFTKQ